MEKRDLDGCGIMKNAKYHNIYEGEWKDDLREGKGKITWRDKNYYDGEWSCDEYGRGIHKELKVFLKENLK